MPDVCITLASLSVAGRSQCPPASRSREPTSTRPRIPAGRARFESRDRDDFVHSTHPAGVIGNARVVRPGGRVYAAELVLRETVAKPSQFTEAEWCA